FFSGGRGCALDRFGPGVGCGLHLRRLRDRLGRCVGLHQRWGGLGGAAVEIGNRAGYFESRRRREFVRDRSGKAVFQLGTTPAASAATAATARAPLAIGRLIAAGHAGLFVAFVLVGFAVLSGRAFDGLARDAHRVTILARGAAFTRFATTAPASAALAAVAVSFAFARCRLGGIVGQALGLFGFDLGFGVEVKRL